MLHNCTTQFTIFCPQIETAEVASNIGVVLPSDKTYVWQEPERCLAFVIMHHYLVAGRKEGKRWSGIQSCQISSLRTYVSLSHPFFISLTESLSPILAHTNILRYILPLSLSFSQKLLLFISLSHTYSNIFSLYSITHSRSTLSPLSLSLSLSFFLSFFLSFYLSFYLSVFISFSLSLSLFFFLSFFLSFSLSLTNPH